MSNRVQPWSEAVDRRSAGERPVGFEQSILNRLVGVAVAEQLRAMPDQRAAITVDDRLERRFGPLSDKHGEPLVALHPQRQPSQTGGGHELRIHEASRTVTDPR